MISKRIFLCVIAAAITQGLYAQDTVRITLQQAEQQFLQRNLPLIAEKYNIGIAQAQVMQAKLYNNPNLSLGGSIYNPELKKYADVGNKTGQYTIELQQLITLAGKRNKQVKLALTEVSMAESRFFELLRALSYTLRSNFYKAYYLQNSIQAFGQQLSQLEQVAATYARLQASGIVPVSDVLRIKSLLYSLKAEQTLLLNQLNEVEGELRLLLNDNNAWYLPEGVADNVSPVKSIPLQTLLDTAFRHRQDLQLARHEQRFSEQNYSLQKALAVPDLTIGAMFDKRSDYIENATLLNLSMDLPFFHRNQGGIKSAKLSVQQNKVTVQQQMAAVENEVRTAYGKAVNADNMLNSIAPDFRDTFEQLLQRVTTHFIKKEIGLLEFTDFYDSYKENVLQLNEMRNERMQAIEALNFTLGKNLLNQ